MKLKKVLAGVLATSTVLTLAGCGGSGSNSGGSKPAGNSGASSNAASNANRAQRPAARTRAAVRKQLPAARAMCGLIRASRESRLMRARSSPV